MLDKSSFHKHFKCLKKWLRVSVRMRDCVTKETAIQVYQGLVQPYFSYGAPVWDGFGKTLSEKLQKLQIRVDSTGIHYLLCV